MTRKFPKPSGDEPILRNECGALSGMEPALSRQFGPPYGRFRMKGFEAPPVTGRRRPLVLLAISDQGSGELASLLANSNGYDVRICTDGAEALTLVRTLVPDLLVVGIRLINLDGLSLIRHLRASPDPLVKALPVLVMNVVHRADALWQAFESGADDYLEMPYEITGLLAAWRRVCGGRRQPAPLTALFNGQESIREVAADYLIKTHPAGLETALGEMLWQPDPEVRRTVRALLARLGTAEAREMLTQAQIVERGKEESA